MTDDKDDWMNPQTPFSLQSPSQPKYGTKRYVVERQKRQITFGYPGSITQWDTWSTHDTAKERDEAYEKLCKVHPVWQLRTRTQMYRSYGWEYLGHWVNDDE